MLARMLDVMCEGGVNEVMAGGGDEPAGCVYIKGGGS